MYLELTSAFPTLIGRVQVPDTDALNQELRAIILAEEGSYASAGRPDFLLRPEPAVAGLTTLITGALRSLIQTSAGPAAFKGTLSLSASTAICRAGAYQAPRAHPDSAWSGVYYVDSGTGHPDHPLDGVLEFLDPRGGAEAVTAPGDPYGEPLRVRPEPGLLVVFPSWLYHWVHPYAGQTPRIAVSFNATLAAVGPAGESITEAFAAAKS